MCGIAGATAVRPEQLEPVLNCLAHRGPDAEGLFEADSVILGHRRLSIIDLSEAGRQPMRSDDGKVVLTFNGEIYNYKLLRSELIQLGRVFRTNTDSEVILHGYQQWGLDGMVRRLRGMFAFAIYDQVRFERNDSYLFLVRDRLGIKPIYYTEQNGRLAFASELKALRRAGLISGALDDEAVAGFLCMGSVPSPRTWLRDARCLPPGSYLTVSREGTRLTQYWDLKECDGGAPTAEQMRQLLAETIDQHMVADVPVGIFLSGGVDSAAITAAASRGATSKLVTLTVTFPEAEFSEEQEARQIAKAFGTEHREIPISRELFLAEIPRLLSAFDQPTADGVNTYFVSRAAKEAGLKVVLSGLGGDEIFLGYPHYHKLFSPGNPLRMYAAAPGWVRGAVQTGGSAFGQWSGQERWQRFEYGRHLDTTQGAYMLTRGFFGPRQAAELLGCSESWIHEALNGSFRDLGVASTNGHFDTRRFQYFELKRYLHDQLLRDSDVFSMAHSIELRVPLLDHELVEAANRISMADHMDKARNKPVLVDAAAHAAVTAAAKRPKRGFTFPFAKWMRESAGQLEDIAVANTPFQKKNVKACWEQLRQGRMHWSRAWATVAASASDIG